MKKKRKYSPVCVPMCVCVPVVTHRGAGTPYRYVHPQKVP